MNIFSYIPGFRSRTPWKMIIASLYYTLVILTSFSSSFGQVLGYISMPFVFFHFIDLIKFKKKEHKFFTVLTCFILSFTVFAVALAITKNANDKKEEDKVNNELVVHFIDVGQGDSIFIDYGDYDILIDAGNNSDGDLVVNYLKSLNVDDIEIMIATHPHEDHVGGLDNVLASYEVENIIDSGLKYNSKTYQSYWEACEIEIDNGSKYIEDEDIVFELDNDLEFKVIEMGDGFKNVNNNSIVCLLDYNDIEFLFMGDLEADIEKKNLNKFNDIDVLKIAQHGSKTSTSIEFLDVIKPEYGIISCGKDNSQGHPHIETLVNLDLHGTLVYGTWKSGNIIIKTDGTSYNLNTNKKVYIDDAGNIE